MSVKVREAFPFQYVRWEMRPLDDHQDSFASIVPDVSEDCDVYGCAPTIIASQQVIQHIVDLHNYWLDYDQNEVGFQPGPPDPR